MPVEKAIEDGDGGAEDLDSSNNLLTRRLFGNSIDDPVARVSSTGTLSYYAVDRQHTVRNLTDARGTV